MALSYCIRDTGNRHVDDGRSSGSVAANSGTTISSAGSADSHVLSKARAQRESSYYLEGYQQALKLGWQEALPGWTQWPQGLASHETDVEKSKARGLKDGPIGCTYQDVQACIWRAGFCELLHEKRALFGRDPI